MNKILFFLLIGLTLTFSACWKKAGQGKQQISLDISEKGITIGGETVYFPIPAEKFEKWFGPSDRQSDLANYIRTWDKWGIISYSYPNTPEKIHTANVYFQLPEDLAYAPENIWTKSVTVNGQPVSEKSTKKDLENIGFSEDDLLDDWMNYKFTRTYLIAEMDENGMILEMEFGDETD